ncbi:hypothetical protein [Nonomuraea sp. CA-141351]|uniref:hypothetical protein n=1 Tax=Nonomuraea sp. CA-141351 TaxID=3239996 RepID=UPI003D90CDBE
MSLAKHQPEPPPLSDDCVWLQSIDQADPTCYQHNLTADQHRQDQGTRMTLVRNSGIPKGPK